MGRREGGREGEGEDREVSGIRKGRREEGRRGNEWGRGLKEEGRKGHFDEAAVLGHAPSVAQDALTLGLVVT